MVKIQQTFLKPNGKFGMCRMVKSNPDTILNSNPRGFGCIFKATLDTTELATKNQKNDIFIQGEIQQTFLKPNGKFGMCRMDKINPDTILNSNPRGLDCIFKATLDTTERATKNQKKNFFEKFRDYISRDPSWNFPVI
jgi:hypothetical protein